MALFGAVTNLLRLPLVFESEWVFGGVAALAVAQFRRPWEAALVALFASTTLFYFWGSAWSGLIFALEAACVAWLSRQGLRHVVVADALFWLVLGGPLAYWIISSYPEQVTPSHAFTLTFKQAANGLLCAHLASALALSKRVQTWLGGTSSSEARPTLQHILTRQLSVVLAALGMLFFVWDMQVDLEQTRNAINNELVATRLAAEAQIEKKMASRESALEEGAAHLADLWSRPTRLQWALNTLHNRLDGMITMLVARPDGQIVYASPPESLKLADPSDAMTVRDRDYFRAALSRAGVYISDGFMGRGFGHDPIAAMSTRIVAPSDGSLLGVLEGSLDLATLEDLHVLFPANAMSEGIVEDRQGKILFSSPGLDLPSLARLTLESENTTLGEPTVSILATDAEGKIIARAKDRYFYQISALPWGWKLVSFKPSAGVVRMVETRMFLLAAGLAFLALVASWLASMLSRFWVSPLQSLTENVRNMPHNIDQPIPVTEDLPQELAGLLEVIEWSRKRLAAGTSAMQEEIIRRTEELKIKNEQLERLAGEDPLTHLPNRRTFDKELRKNWAHCQRHHLSISLILVDLDHFKRLNDVYGHPAGDAVLRDFGGVLRRFVRRETDVCARVGGEEFALLLPATGFEKAMDIAEKLRVYVAQHVFVVAESQLRLTLSAGVCTAQPPDHDLNYMYKQTDDALYAAKKQGRNRVQGIDLSGSRMADDPDI
jgi:diguanylate cyclase (GGDEF)-like protein